ncbi:MAG: ABC transporter ATP-binding protein [Pseudomonadota bacterium]|nr:ABC transporter ATP-binding protein [Pseudomonadota bacterium]
MNVLDVCDLSVEFRTIEGPVHALRHVDVSVPRGKIVGVVGESGSGKSTLALAIMGLMQANAAITGGRAEFGGKNLFALSPAEMRDVRGPRISMIFQDPMTSLNPVRSIGRQMSDIQYRDHSASSGEKLERAAEALRLVGLPDAVAQLKRYPHQFSGGMRQRIAIAMSLLQKPELLIADEITTALDVTLEAQILHLLRELRTELEGSILFISHNLGAIAEICDMVVVLYAGEVVEHGPVDEIFNRPQHPYTRALIECDPARIALATRGLPVIPGEVPNLRSIPAACIFAPRCPLVFARCRAERPADIRVAAGHAARCHLAEASPA